MYYSCQNELGTPGPSKNGGTFTSTGNYWGWWRSDSCLIEVNKGYAINLMIAAGFMTLEVIII
jgi:hypothetical protein